MDGVAHAATQCGRVTETSTVSTSAGRRIAPDADADAAFARTGWLRLSAR